MHNCGRLTTPNTSDLPLIMNATLSPHRSPTVRRKGSMRRRGSHLPPTTKETHDAALHAIRHFLKGRTTYDAFPVSFRLIVLDTKLNVKKALQCLLLNGEFMFLLRMVRSASSLSRVTGVVSAPLWNSEHSKFAGMLTVLDIIHLIQHYYHTASYDSAAADVEHFKLESLRGTSYHPLSSMWHPIICILLDIEKRLGVATPPLLREHPSSSLYEAAKLLIQTHARRLPLLDNDTETGHEVIVSVLTQYRLLKFISINVCIIINDLGYILLIHLATVDQGDSAIAAHSSQAWYWDICPCDTWLRNSGRPKSICTNCDCDTNHPGV